MADRPILFSGPMVRALLAGTKTQTRRIIKPQPPEGIVRHCWYDAPIYGFTKDHDVTGDWHKARLLAYKGDRLWVRETLACCIDWGLFYDAHGGIGPSEQHFLRDERADAIVERYSRDDESIWNVPSIFMPRWASRLTLTVTDVKVERLQDISAEDAIAEGIVDTGRRDGAPYSHFTVEGVPGITVEHEPEPVYAQLWEKINGVGSWDANPWIVAYTFTVHHGNIDQIAREA